MIRDYRILRKLTQEQLAELVDVTPRQIQRIENNQSEPSLNTLKKLIKVLVISDKDIVKIMKQEKTSF